MKKISLLVASLLLLLMVMPLTANADSFDQVMQRWMKKQLFQSDMDGNLTVKVIYYSAEYMEAYIQSEAKKNLWTESETEDFKYKFLTALNLNETIPIYIEFVNNGPTMYLGPFDNMVSLRIKNKTYKRSNMTSASTSVFRDRRTVLYSFPGMMSRQAKIYLQV